MFDVKNCVILTSILVLLLQYIFLFKTNQYLNNIHFIIIINIGILSLIIGTILNISQMVQFAHILFGSSVLYSSLFIKSIYILFITTIVLSITLLSRLYYKDCPISMIEDNLRKRSNLEEWLRSRFNWHILFPLLFIISLFRCIHISDKVINI